jgi:hypothetical protein
MRHDGAVQIKRRTNDHDAGVRQYDALVERDKAPRNSSFDDGQRA